jgi:broad specificity polyphosphatase/5'/3'-nucleotidase SurE
LELQGKPAIAFSLDNFKALQPGDYAPGALLCIPLIKATLDRLEKDADFQAAMAGNVLNVNLPFGAAKGYYLTHMSTSCVMAKFSDASPAVRSRALLASGVPEGPKVHVLEGAASIYQRCPPSFIC